MLSPTDISDIQTLNLSIDQVQNQIDRFEKGFELPVLHSSATQGNAIVKLTEEEIEEYSNLYQESSKSVLKFVPASGAATRMFKSLFEYLDNEENSEVIDSFFDSIKSFAFYDDLSKVYEKLNGLSIESGLDQKDHLGILKCLLLNEGLGYGQLPKGLLDFHKYDQGSRTPLEEHIHEGIMYAEKNNAVDIHFTVSPAHHELFKDRAQHIRTEEFTVNLSYSYQESNTNTIAVDSDNNPFRSSDGSLLFRPAGHGALLQNLNRLESDIIFVKNIDNVVPDRLKGDTVKYKRALAGALIKHQEETFSLLRRHDNGEDIKEEATELLSKLGCKGDLTDSEIIEKLNRPIRVCGMVRNEGEPGGGPFWVQDGESASLQIVESAQVDMNNEGQVKIFKESTHFNPVDLVCGIKNYNGEKFDLIKFRDENLGMITEKSYQGRTLKAMELPGLWNGSMANWNTIFVEVPLSTFNPVKTVMDLLKDSHQ